jgi:hypothetical protein
MLLLKMVSGVSMVPIELGRAHVRRHGSNHMFAQAHSFSQYFLENGHQQGPHRSL